MDKALIFIDNTNSFITKSIINNLKVAGKNCEMISLNVKALDTIKDRADGYIFYNIADIATVDTMGITYLHDLCVEKDYVLTLMGFEEDIQSLKNSTFKGMEVQEFHRPINAKEASERIIAMTTENPNGLKKHIMVVDDSGTMLTTIESWLKDKYRLTLVNSALNAFTFLANSRPDLILLDYEMPACSGAKFLEMLRGDIKTEDIPVIFLTGKGDVETVKSVVSLKPAGYLLKSMPREHIVGEVDAFFQKQKSLGQ